MPKINRADESLRKALEIACVDWDNVVVIASKFDVMKNMTIPGCAEYGNSYAIDAQVMEWMKEMKEIRDGDMGCGPGCDCGAPPEDHDDVIGNDSDDDDEIDDIGNR